MKTKIIIENLLTSILIFGIFLIPYAVFNLSFARFVLSNVPYLLISGGFSLILGFTINKNRMVGGVVIFIILALISSFMLFVNMMDNLGKEQVVWNSSEDRFMIDFVVGNSGHIYLNATVNDVSGLFLFDTGASISVVDERFVVDTKMKLQPFTLVDVKGIKQTKDLYKVKSFELGAFEIKRLQVYPKDSLTWILPQGILYKKDSIVGVIGNNIISKFIWDFDLINSCVTISNSKKYCKDLPDSLAINLYPVRSSKNIPVKINGVEKLLTLDFGASIPLSISDSIINSSNPDDKKRYSQRSGMGAFNHLDTMASRNSNIKFADVEFGAFKYHQIKCQVNEHSDLLGIPFIWSFERVVVDYMNDKAYFMAENDHKFAVNRFSQEYSWKSAKEIKINGTGSFDFNFDSTRLVFYGRLTLYQNNSRTDSIFYQDSLLLPDGQLQYGPATMKFDHLNKDHVLEWYIPSNFDFLKN